MHWRVVNRWTPAHCGKQSKISASIRRKPTRPSVSKGEKVTVTEFKLPELGENIDQGDLVRLMVSPGATITEGQAVMELETDKAVVEVPSTVSGVVKEVRVKEGEKIKVGQVIFTFENGAGGVARAPSPAKEPKAQQAAASASGAKGSPVENPPPIIQRERRTASAPSPAPPTATEFKLPEL